jgi:hypothetical protein
VAAGRRPRDSRKNKKDAGLFKVTFPRFRDVVNITPVAQALVNR